MSLLLYFGLWRGGGLEMFIFDEESDYTSTCMHCPTRLFLHPALEFDKITITHAARSTNTCPIACFHVHFSPATDVVGATALVTSVGA
jgi:hypothetical protein